jgi:hypothetical protein
MSSRQQRSLESIASIELASVTGGLSPAARSALLKSIPANPRAPLPGIGGGSSPTARALLNAIPANPRAALPGV